VVEEASTPVALATPGPHVLFYHNCESEDTSDTRGVMAAIENVSPTPTQADRAKTMLIVLFEYGNWGEELVGWTLRNESFHHCCRRAGCRQHQHHDRRPTRSRALTGHLADRMEAKANCMRTHCARPMALCFAAPSTYRRMPSSSRLPEE
jgi:hypothetical protein